MLAKKVKIVEVGPRDGLQNEAVALSVEQRVELVNKLTESGLSVIEAGSFVSPKWVPQMAGSDEVLRTIKRKASVSYPVLTPNERGYQDAISAGAEEVAVFAAASETFSRKNINCSIDASLQKFAPVCARARADNVRVRAYISCVLDCPYEGKVSHQRVTQLASALLEMGCAEISLGDTIGTGTPIRVQQLINSVQQVVAVEKIAVHFHDTYGQALANIHASLQMGIATIDSAVAGLGGCPYAHGAAGNVATEDVLFMLDGMAIKTGVSMEKLLAASRYICTILGRESGSKASIALQRAAQ